MSRIFSSPVTPLNRAVGINTHSHCTFPSLKDFDIRAKELSNRQVYQEDRWKDCDRRNRDERKRMDARISDVKQKYYTRLLEIAYGDHVSIIQSLRAEIAAKAEENSACSPAEYHSLVERNNQLEQEKESVLKENNKLKSHLLEMHKKQAEMEANQRIIMNQLYQLGQQHGNVMQEKNQLEAKCEKASEENNRLKSDPILSAIRNNPEILNIEATSSQADVSCKVVEDVPAAEEEGDSNINSVERSIDSFLSPRGNLVQQPPSAHATPSRQFRKLTLEVKYSSPQVPPEDIPPATFFPPDLTLPTTLLGYDPRLLNEVISNRQVRK